MLSVLLAHGAYAAYVPGKKIDANSVLANPTAAAALPIPSAMPPCSGSTSALTYTTNTGFGCHTISSGGTPGGSSGQIQYNNSGAFGGLTLDNSLVINSLVLGTTNVVENRGSTTSDPIISGYMGKTLTYNSGSSVAISLPAAGSAGFEAGKSFSVVNRGTGTDTLTAASGLINTATTAAIGPDSGGFFISDGTNWVKFATGSGGGGSGTVTSGLQYALGFYSSAGTTISGNTNIFTNSSNQLGVGAVPSNGFNVEASVGSTGSAFLATGSNSVGYPALRMIETASGGVAWNLSVFAGSAPLAGNACLIQTTAGLTSHCFDGTSLRELAGGAITWSSSASSNNVNPDVTIGRLSADIFRVGNATVTTGGKIAAAALLSEGTKFTAVGCSNGTTVGGASAGKFTLGANTCTVAITMGNTATAPAGWSCSAKDETAPTVLIGQTASTTTTATLNIPAGAGATDVINFHCIGY